MWGPRLLAGYGAGLVGAGAFVADPMNGFPLGTPDGPPAATTIDGMGHLVFGALGFACLIAACFALARHYRAQERAVMTWFSRITGAVFLVAFVGIASGSASPVIVLGFWVAVALAWAWLAVVSVDLYRRTPLLTPVH